MSEKSGKLKMQVKGITISVFTIGEEDFISLTDMMKAKDGDFFISDWLRNRNTLEYLGIWEQIYNPDFNYGEFAIIKSQTMPVFKIQNNSVTKIKTKQLDYEIKPQADQISLRVGLLRDLKKYLNEYL